MALPIMRSRVDRGLADFQDEVSRLFSDFVNWPSYQLGSWSPAANVLENENMFVVEMEVPGFTREEIDVTLEQGVLSINGQRSEEKEEEQGSYHLRERTVGRFSRSFSLPRSIEADRLSASLDKGILRVELPKAPEAKARRIEVKVK